MTGSTDRRCPRCGDDLVLQMAPSAPLDGDAGPLLADPPFRFVCASSDCSLPAALG